MTDEPTPACTECRHFIDSPLGIEASFPGLSSLSSGFASVRSNDGLCLMHDRYVAGSSLCERYALRVEVLLPNRGAALPPPDCACQ